MSTAVSLAMQFGGQGRLEGHPEGELDGARYEGRFVFFGLTGERGPVFGEDISLFDPARVAEVGRGVRSAHLVGLRSGYALEGFSTSEDDYAGHMYGRSSSKTRLRVFFDQQPDGSRSFSDRQSFMRGEEIASYQAEEFFQLDGRAGVFDTRVHYNLLRSKPFTFDGVTVDLAHLATTMAELAHGHNPEEGISEPIPHTEEPFTNRGPGYFAERFAVGGTILASL